MSRLISNVLKRDQVMERLMARPFSLALGAALVFAQAAIYVAEISGVPFGRLFSLDYATMNLGGLLFPLTHYAPVSDAVYGAGFQSLDFVFSLALFALCGLSVLHCGPVVEGYYGTRRTFATFLMCCLGHALVVAALPAGFAWGSLSFAMFLAVTALLARLERRDDHSDAEADSRALLVLGGLILAAVGAAFLPHPAYDGLLAAAGVGPVLAVTAFVVNRRLQLRRVHRAGQGQVGDLYFVDETDLLTRPEIEARMDRLLAKIGAAGMESLSPEERRFLRHASQRLKRAPSEEFQA